MRIFALFGSFLSLIAPLFAQDFRIPTANRALFQPGREIDYFVGTVGKPWASGTFGCVRSEGNQMHEGIDIRCTQRDRKGEPMDPVMSTAEGNVAYINRRAGLSNYGNYIILRHMLDGLEVYSLYGHLRFVKPELQVGHPVKAGQIIGTLGRTANTKQGISKDRAHLHFELNFFISEKFNTWHQQTLKGQRNDHGIWNGQNLIALDPIIILRRANANRKSFSLVDHIREQEELCRVFVRAKSFPWLKRYPQLVHRNPRANKEGIVGYEISLNYNGLPFRLMPRAASEIKGNQRVQLLSVNAAEEARHGCRHLVSRKASGWSLSERGMQLVELLVF